MTIRGTVTYQDISGGFWGIVDAAGNAYRPIKMPKKLQKDGLKVKLKVEKDTEGGFSIFMWGTSVKILEFEIMNT